MPRNVIFFGVVSLAVIVTGLVVLTWRALGGGPLLSGSAGSGRAATLPVIMSEQGAVDPAAAYPAAGDVVAGELVGASAETPRSEERHIVQPGETLMAISTLYGVTIDELVAANGLTNPDALAVGQELIIPGEATAGEPQSVQVTDPSAPVLVNGLGLGDIVIMPPNVVENARKIYALGQARGRNSHAYSKVGDSTIANPHFMARFDETPYNLADHAYLQPTIDYFAGSHGRDSAAQAIGLHAWTVFDPIWADNTICQPNETPLACEFRLHNPAVVFIRLGSNDAGVPEMFGDSIREIVQYSIDNGVIPVIGTKADRHEGSNQNNDILRQIAAEYQVPLWEFDVVAGTMPGRGLDVDNVHMLSFYAHDYALPEAYTRGHSLHNLTALMMLDAILKDVIEG